MAKRRSSGENAEQGENIIVNAELWIAAALSAWIAVQLWRGVVLLPRRSWFERWLHDLDDSDRQVWRRYEPVKYWLYIAVECAVIAYLWWRGFTVMS